MIWYLPGLAFLQVGGSFVELAGVAAAGLVVGLIFRHFLARTSRRDQMRQYLPELPKVRKLRPANGS